MGWGNFLDRISKYFKTPEQSLKDQKYKLERERNEILSQKETHDLRARYIIITDKLREIDAKLNNLYSSKG